MTAFLWLLRATVLLSFALLAERLVRPLRLRRMFLIFGAVGALALPLIVWGLAPLTASLPSISPTQIAEWVPTSLPGGAQDTIVPPPTQPHHVLPSRRIDVIGWVVMVWWLGSIALALRAVAGRLWLAQTIKRARPAPPAWSRGRSRIPVRISDAVHGTALAGPWPRAVLLPCAAEGWDPQQRDQILLHERAHARAKDDWILLLMQLLAIALWPTPLVWVVRRRARLLAELAADEAVVQSGVSPLAYADTLTRMARQDWTTRAGLVAASTQSVLETRVRALLAGRHRGARRAHLFLAGVASVLMIGVIACVPSQTPTTTANAHPRALSALQAAVAAELDRIQARWQPTDAAIVVMDAHSGELLASGDLSEGGLVETPLELGSVLKPFTVAAALESGVAADAEFPGHDGRWRYHGVTIEDSRPAEWLTLSDTLAYSSNIGAAALIEEIGVQPVLSTFQAVGLSGLPVVEDHTPAAAYLSMGLGVRVSPTSLARSYTILGNNGVDPLNGVMRFQPMTVRVVHQGLAAALSAEGTAHAANVAGALGGKTGTAHYGDGFVATFAGLWRTPDSTLSVVIVVVNPDTDRPYGGAVAAPSFARLLKTR